MATQEHSTSTSSGATGNVPTLGSIEDALSLILSVDTDLEAIESTLVPALSRCTDTLLASSIHDDQDPLSLLKPQSHSAGIVFILSARLASPATQESALATAPSIVQALEVDQARLAAQRGTYYCKLARAVPCRPLTHRIHLDCQSSISPAPCRTLVAVSSSRHTRSPSSRPSLTS